MYKPGNFVSHWTDESMLSLTLRNCTKLPSRLAFYTLRKLAVCNMRQAVSYLFSLLKSPILKNGKASSQDRAVLRTEAIQLAIKTARILQGYYKTARILQHQTLKNVPTSSPGAAAPMKRINRKMWANKFAQPYVAHKKCKRGFIFHIFTLKCNNCTWTKLNLIFFFNYMSVHE